jgi:hypothetical protein
MKGKAGRRHLVGFGIARSVLVLDALTVQEIGEALDPGREDRRVNPWKWGYNAAIRKALGRWPTILEASRVDGSAPSLSATAPTNPSG